MSRIGGGSMGFAGLSVPTGYGSVSLRASINGIDLGDAWSKRTAYTEGTEHAEDTVVDLVEQIEAALEFPNTAFVEGLNPAVLESVRSNQRSGQPSTLVIDNLTTSPCSRLRGTCNKPDMVGCADRLIELTRSPESRTSWRPSYQVSSYGRPIRVPPPTPQGNQPGITWAITINADHYYQPPGVAGAKQKSAAAVQDMRQAGIIVNIRRP